MRRIPAIKTVMTPFPYSVEADATLDQAREFMREHRIRHLPVTEHGRLVGLISDRDIKLVLGPDFAYPPEKELRVRDAMVRDAYVIDLDTHLDEVLHHMAQQQLGSAIVTRQGKLAGVFTTTDACHHFAEFLREQFRRSGGDAA
ncbi:MAG: CBS domain-containing protein [Gammaproteobacteria bacterium]|nr:MAG: CBS domain-containing protein [Gammaproteobacteria bacterium]